MAFLICSVTSGCFEPNSERARGTTKILERAVKHLTRVRERGPGSRSLYFTFDGAPRAVRHNVTFVKVEDVPDFDGEDAWFEMERVQHKPWSYWRAVRQVEPHAELAPQVPSWKTW